MDLADLAGHIDFGILTIREDEFRAVLARFPERYGDGRARGLRVYNLRRLGLGAAGTYTIAILRCIEQGNGEALAAARDLLEDLAPRWLLVIGIAGATPAPEFTLGDVVVSTRIVDFSVEALLHDGSFEHAVTGGAVHREAAILAANLPAVEAELGPWNTSASIQVQRPTVDLAPENFYGDEAWQEKVRKTLQHHFGGTPRPPCFTAGALAVSDRLVRDAERAKAWLRAARQFLAIEMESGGVHRATYGRDVPFLAIRGISDVIGFNRDPAWTEYACHSAAAFARAFLLTMPIEPHASGRAGALRGGAPTSPGERDDPRPGLGGSPPPGPAAAASVGGNRECLSPLSVVRDAPPAATALPDPLSHRAIHALPPAPLFVGRERELAELHRVWDSQDVGVASLVGLGGAGKTAIVAEFLSRLASGRRHRPDRLFVWSFYIDQDVGTFLREAYAYFAAGEQPDERGIGLAYRLVERLTQAPGRSLIVMDGLERVQRGLSDRHVGFGELEDPLLRHVMSRLALGVGSSKCLITSRFPLADLRRWKGRGYRCVDVDQLDRGDARRLLSHHRIRGEQAAFDRIIDEYGAHALTLDHLGIYLAEFCGGDALAAHDLQEPRIDSDLPEERKLARVLHAYERSLTPVELALLSRFCIFRFGATPETLHTTFAKSGDSRVAGPLIGMTEIELRRIVKRLVDLHLVLVEPGEHYTAHPAIRDHFYQLFTECAAAHDAARASYRSLSAVATLEAFEQFKDRLEALQTELEALRRSERRKAANEMKSAEAAILSLIRAWPRHSRRAFGESIYLLTLAAVPERRWLAGSVKVLVRSLVYRWVLSGLDYDDIFEGALADELSLFSRADHRGHLSGLSSLQRLASMPGWRPLEEILNNLWFALSAIRDRWQAHELRRAGTLELATDLESFLSRYQGQLDLKAINKLRGAIVALRAGDFPELPTLALSHARLSAAPGVEHPSDGPTLDLLEELIHHTVRAGDVRGALDIYRQRLGGREHLGKRIGEYARGLRILRSLPGEPLDLAWYLRACGELSRALDIIDQVHPLWAGTILCLRGFLPRAATGRYWRMTREVARFLMGKGIPTTSVGWGEAMVDAEIAVLAGRLELAEDVNESHAPEMARTRLALADAARRRGGIEEARRILDSARPWILHSCSVEHLCLLHLISGRISTDRADHACAAAELAEGLHLADTWGFGIYFIDLMNEQARSFLAQASLARAQGLSEEASAAFARAAEAALKALNGVLLDTDQPAATPDAPLSNLRRIGARHPECQYAWGAAEGMTLLGKASCGLGRLDEGARWKDEAAKLRASLPRVSA
ncbi:hypothetical protein WMF11_43100 [Sorangium sp. So ce295]|uniref:5'-methylthioadenosine/S-adenosylhomocysteine nucleosidase family protein n=1 Tax=Sorangium sp. So ce295 TaxID=3133295 RepID=UPI003F5E3B3B